MEKELKTKRVKWVDSARGIGIVLILLAHACPTALRMENSVAGYIYNVGLVGREIFFFLAGYTFQLTIERKRNESLKQYISEKSKSLLLPYLLYGGMILAIFSICFYIPGLSSLMEKTNYGRVTLTKALRGVIIGDIPYGLHLWFLYDLFVFSALTFGLVKKFKKYGKVLCLIMAVLLWKVMEIRDWQNYVAIVNIMYFYIWFVVGSILPVEKIEKTKCIFIGILLLLFYYILSFYNVEINMKYGIWIFKLCKEVAMAGGGIALIIGGVRYLDNNEQWVLPFLGKKSFDMYIFQQPFFGSVLGTILYKMLHINGVVVIAITFLISLIGTLLISNIIDNTHYLKKAFGRK